VIYAVGYTPRAVRMLKKLPSFIQPHLHIAIESLAQNPRPQGCRKLTGQELWRIRVGSYRIVYQIEDDRLLVLVIKIGHRKDIYR
jgi:mRNA interferase RelE/StbE